MTSKIYKTAQGISIDLGTLILQNEHVRAVGNMKVNARGDKIDGQNQIIETKPQQIQKHNNRITTSMSSSTVRKKPAVNKLQPDSDTQLTTDPIVDPVDLDESNQLLQTTPVAPTVDPVVVEPLIASTKSTTTSVDKGAGLAGAIARTRQIKQELDRTRRQQAQDSGVKKI